MTQRLVALVLGVISTLGLVGCGGLEPVATYDPITDAGQLYLSLRLDHRAIVLSTTPAYNTIQLTATPRNALGEAMTGLPAPTFTSLDTSAVSVTADGVVHGLKVVDAVPVIAELRTGDNVRHADTALVKVTNLTSPPELASVSIHPQFPDSAVRSMVPFSGFSSFMLFLGGARDNLDTWYLLYPQAFSTSGSSIPSEDLLFAYESLNPDVAVFDNGEIHPTRPGQVGVVVTTTAYGITKTDTATYTMIRPTALDIRITSAGFVPSHTIVAKSALVTWVGTVPVSMDVTFDDPTNVAEPVSPLCSGWDFFVDVFQAFLPGPYCGAGNIAPFVGSDGTQLFATAPDGTKGARMRQFPVPGVYTFRNTVNGTTGTLEVVDYP